MKIKKNRGYLIKIIALITIFVIEICMIATYSIVYSSSNKVVDAEVVHFTNSSLAEFDKNNNKNEIIDYASLVYYIRVNIKSQNVMVYAIDENNNHNVLIKTMICSTGKDTPQNGVFYTSDKYEWRELYGKVYGQYATRITGPILFHSVPYQKRSKDSLEYWEYDKLGEPASLGCVRLTVEDAKWIYDYCKPGTAVEFYNGEVNEIVAVNQPIKISEYDEELRNWDPTDPDENNPWNN